MKVSELLAEKTVSSAWISDVTNHRNKNMVRMSLSDGKVYIIDGMSRRQFDHWHNSSSKGKFFHQKVKNKYNIVRIK